MSEAMAAVSPYLGFIVLVVATLTAVGVAARWTWRRLLRPALRAAVSDAMIPLTAPVARIETRQEEIAVKADAVAEKADVAAGQAAETNALLKPNGGTSIGDQLNRLETQVGITAVQVVQLHERLDDSVRARMVLEARQTALEEALRQMRERTDPPAT